MSNPVDAILSSPESCPEDQVHLEDVTADQLPADGPSEAPPSSELPRSPLSGQKRRRVTRACDECRRKKIKCDGKQPCTHCTVYSYDCTYDQPSNRRRNPAPQHYIEALQSRLRRAEAIIKAELPDVNLDEDDLDTNAQHQPPVPQRAWLDTSKPHPTPASQQDDKSRSMIDQDGDALLESMVDATGQLNLDDRGHWDFHGHSSGFNFFRKINQRAEFFALDNAQFGKLFGPDDIETQLSGLSCQAEVIESPKSSMDTPMDMNLPNTTELPARSVAKALASNALDDACALLRFVHQPTFYTLLDRIYDLAPEAYGDEENRYLALLYMVLAYGSLFAKAGQGQLEKDCATIQGYKYFRVCRQMIDITDCRDITSLQALIFMILFLQCSARLTTCYSYIGIALRAALRMGLHRSLSTRFTPVERETRKRVFWAIRKLDIYAGAILGLPKSLSDDDFDQEYPLEVDDEYITEDAILPMPDGKVSPMAGANAHMNLVNVLAKVIKYIYPVKGVERTIDERGAQSYRVKHARVKEIEHELQAWMDDLPAELLIGGESSPEFLSHIQMMLYRPFLHYVAQGHSQKPIDRRSYACAVACVGVCRNLIHISTEMKKRGLLNGAYWFIMYTTFFSVLTLVFYVLENSNDPGTEGILKDAQEGKDTLADLAKKNLAAHRCNGTLTALFDQLPEKLKRSRKTSMKVKKKKRPAPSPSHDGSEVSKSNTDLSRSIRERIGPLQRSSTFPTHPNTSSLDGVSIQANGHPMLLTADAQLRHQRIGSHDAFTPSDLSAVQTPDSSPNSTHVPQQHHAHFSMQQSPDLNSFPQLNAMMFPSTDPFAYPNNPMIILEDQQHQKQGSSDPAPDHFMFMHDQSAGGPYDKMEVQLFGPLPPYLMQGQQLVSGQQYPSDHLATDGLPNSPPDMYAAQPTNVTGIPPGFNLEDVFGNDEWSNNNLLIGHHYQQGYSNEAI
ncbi:MAG: hypothetical protein M1816_000532 [Peltula sp. TS41687]|nr:MAG: hypothetical protein M1816_000532 [Peltula sp. TS41687]